MGWSVGWDYNWNRDIGYGVPAICDHPECSEEIDRGLAYVCCGQQPHGGEYGCGLYFCSEHMGSHYTDNYANAMLAELLETSGWTLEEIDETIEMIQLDYPMMCARCASGGPPFDPKPDLQQWVDHKETHESWAKWREERDSNESIRCMAED